VAPGLRPSYIFLTILMCYVLYLCLQLFMSYSIEAYVSYFFFLLFYYWYYHLYRNSRLFLVKFSYGSQSEDSVAGAEEVNPLETVDSAPTKASSSPLNPYWVTGFADAECSFTIIIEIMSLTSWKVRASFEINLHSRDIAILKRIQYFFGVGTVYSRTDREITVYRVTALADLLNVIIPHFINYPLISQKQADFKLWAQVVEMMSRKEHLILSGFLTILSFYAAINLGVSAKVAEFYPNISPISRPALILPTSLNPFWVSGFCAGEGGFSLLVRTKKGYSLGEKVDYVFRVTQHSRDIALMVLFISFFGCGKVYSRSNPLNPRCDFLIQDVANIYHIVIPHFELYPLENIKHLDFLDFKQGMELVFTKQHLTREGMDRIKTISAGMNTGRK